MVARDMQFESKMALIGDFYAARPLTVAVRLAQVGATGASVALAWLTRAEDRGDRLRDAMSSLGVVFVKLSQTLATRPDIIGDEAADALASLQDANVVFDDGVAMRTIARELGVAPEHVTAARVPAAALEPREWELRRAAAAAVADAGADAAAGSGSESAAPLFAAISDAPIAAASLAQVYRAVTADGEAVAVKVQRPGVASNVALDCTVVRLLLRWLRALGVLSEEADIEEMTAEVGAGLFREIDFRLEAEQAAAFERVHTPLMPQLTVPSSLRALSARRVLTMGWVDGRKLTELGAAEQEAMIRLGLRACFLQLLRTGVIHADPHYGNMLYTPRGQLALLDFGLVTSCTVAQQEAMALGILHTLGRRWEELIGDLRALGLLPPRPSLWVDARTGEPAGPLAPGRWASVDEKTFAAAFVAHMDQEAGADRSFSEMTTALSSLSLSYRFVLPSWMVFIIRAVVTLDGFASELATPISAVDEALPHAVRRALTPRTAEGRRALRELCVDEEGVPRWARLRLLGGRDEAAASAGPSAAAQQPDPASAGPSSAEARLRRAAAEAGALVLEPSVEGGALRRVAVSVSTPSLCGAALRGVVRAQREMLCDASPRERSALRATVLAAARTALLGVASAARALPRGLRVRTRRRLSPWRLQRLARRNRLARMLVRAHAVQLARSPLGALALLALGPALLALVAEAALLEGSARARALGCRLLGARAARRRARGLALALD